MTRARRGVLAGCALAVASGWNIGNVGAIAAELARSYHVGLATIGLLTTALFVTHAATQVPGGRASDRFGPVRTGATAVAFVCLGDLVAVIAPDPAVAIAGRAITGIGTGLAFIAGSAVVREAGGSPFAQGIFGGIGLGIAGVALALVPQVERAAGWRAPYWSSLVVAVGAGAVLVAIAPRGLPRRARAAARDAVAPATPRPRVLADPRLHRLAVLYSASYGLAVVVGNWVVELLQRHSALGDDAAAVIGGLTLLLGVVTRPLGGWILRTRPDRVRLAVAGSLVAGAGGTLALLASGPAWLAIAGGLLIGVAAGIPFAPTFTGAALARPDAPAASVGVVNGVANGVVLAGTPLLGLTFSLSGGGRVGFAAVAALWLAALAALPGPAALGVAPPQPDAIG